LRASPAPAPAKAGGAFYEAVQNVSCFDLCEFFMKCIFLSDAHLTRRRDEYYRDLIRFLDSLRSGQVDRLFIAGDFFDFWFCKDDHIYPHFIEVIEMLVKLQESGTRIVYCEGNHDFFLEDYFGRKLGMTVYPDWAILELDGKRTLVAHGDLVDRDNVMYQMLRRILRSRLFYEVQKRVPSPVLWILAKLGSHTSRGLSSDSEERLVRVMLEFAMEKFRAGFDNVILGHSHQPTLKEFMVDGRKRTFAILGDWTRRKSYLEYQDGRFSLVFYRSPAGGMY
jgi:UDP-2,3-diacylglucosamine hydrolase